MCRAPNLLLHVLHLRVFDRPGCRDDSWGAAVVLSAVSGAPPLPLPAAIDTWDRKQRQPRSRLPNPCVFHNQWILRSPMLRTVFTAPMESQSVAVDSPTLDRLVGKCL